MTSVLFGAILVLLGSSVYLTISKEFSPISVVGIALLPIVIVNAKTLKKMGAERKKRSLP